MNTDNPYRKFRYVEVQSVAELTHRRGFWLLVQGWLEIVLELEPRSSGAVLEGDYIARLPDDSIFLEVTFKTEHRSVEAALPVWAERAGRRWAVFAEDTFVCSDGAKFPAAEVRFEKK